jgi:hypothetical protein
MITRYFALAFASLTLVSCATYDGSYSPNCSAYAGSQIVLKGGQFAWEKFTDSVVIDNDDAVVNQFPGYPMEGTYDINGKTIEFKSDTGEVVSTMYFKTMYLNKNSASYFMLTAEQQQIWESKNEYPRCVLIRN